MFQQALKRAPPAPQGKVQGNGPRQGDEEIYIQGVSGATVGNPDTIHDEVTTQAFSGAIVRKCSQNLLDTII